MPSEIRPAIVPPGTVKVDGSRTAGHAVVAAEAGAGLVGLIFAPGRRRVDLATARMISDAVHATGTGTRVLGVFVDALADEINATIEAARLDLVQLHGDEVPTLPARLDRPALKALRAMPEDSVADLLVRAHDYLAVAEPPITLFVDGYHPSQRGGSGARADWNLVRELIEQLGIPVGLAGGLDPSNVGDAIRQVRPLFVDVSSGVERDGQKDPDLIRAFVAAALAGFRTIREQETAARKFERP